MKTTMSDSVALRIGSALLAACSLASPLGVSAQDFRDIKVARSPLVLQSRGSFFVGGEQVAQTRVEMGLGSDDTLTVNQMYVEFMTPRRAGKPPVIMVHGTSLSGKSFDTTPDGRMGWFEYFVRRGHPTYVIDQVGRARSGFNQAVFNNVRAGTVPPARQPSMVRLSDGMGSWENFRFGTKAGVAHADTQFPVEAAARFSKQGIPDPSSGLPAPNPTFSALSELGGYLKRPVLIGHSQGGRFPTPTALIDPKRFSALVLIEPGNCMRPTGPELTDAELAKLAAVPILIVFGDHLDGPRGLPLPAWRESYDDCRVFLARVNNAGGSVQMLYPPELGIKGNTHMIMQDRNNLQIADLIMNWIEKSAKR